MTDLVLLAEVNHAPSFLGTEEIFEIPLRVIDNVCFIKPSDKTDSTEALKRRTRNVREIGFSAGRALAIKRGDKVLLEGIYDERFASGGYQIQRVNVLSPSRTEQGLALITATYRNLETENELHPYIPASEEVYKKLGVKPPQR